MRELLRRSDLQAAGRAPPGAASPAQPAASAHTFIATASPAIRARQSVDGGVLYGGVLSVSACFQAALCAHSSRTELYCVAQRLVWWISAHRWGPGAAA